MPSVNPGKSSTRSMVASCPPGMRDTRTSVEQPPRAANSAAVKPATPPPMITTSCKALPPIVDRDLVAQAGAHDPPVAIRFASNDDHLDIVVLEHRHQLIRRGLELRRVRLLAE